MKIDDELSFLTLGFFRVRAYRMNGTVKKYGAWSKAYKITIKKSLI